MKRISIVKVVVAIAVSLAFVLPGSAAFVNGGTVGVTSNSGTTGDVKNVAEHAAPISTTTPDNTKEGNRNPLPHTRGTIYVDDNQVPGCTMQRMFIR